MLAEQNTNVALQYAEYAYILENGRVVMEGSAESMRDNEDVKEFYLGISGEGKQSFKDVKQYKKSKNEVYCGNILFGKKRIGKKLVDNNSELEILKTINDLRKQNLSYNKISKYLNDNNILSKEKCKWYGSSVRSVYLNGVLN